MIWQPDEPRGRPPSNQGGSIPYLPRNSTTELIAQPLRQSKQFFRVVVADGIPDKRIDLVPSPEDSIQLCPARIRQFQNIPTTGVRVGFSRDVAGARRRSVMVLMLAALMSNAAASSTWLTGCIW